MPKLNSPDLQGLLRKRRDSNPRPPAGHGASGVPDGSRIAFVGYRDSESDADLWVVRPDATGLKPLTRTISPISNPAWSPDGKQLVYQKDYFFGHDVDLYTIDADGRNEQLAIGHNWRDETASWQPRR